MNKVGLAIIFAWIMVTLEAQDKTHVVQPHETLYSIARSYSISVADLIKENPVLAESTTIKAGQSLRVPAPDAKEIQQTEVAVHVVAQGETLYAISRNYGVSVKDLKRWNSLTELNVKIGQKLLVADPDGDAKRKQVQTPVVRVPTEEVQPVAEVSAETKEQQPQQREEKDRETHPSVHKPADGLRTSSANPSAYAGIFNHYPTKGFQIRKERGAAIYLADNTGGNQFLAFYNRAETNSIIRVTNLMNHKTIYVKVVGKLPQSDSMREVILKLSNSAAKDLGVIDEKFLVEVAAYAAPQP